MGQVNVNYPEGGAPVDRGTGVGTVLAVLVVLAIIALLVWGLALGGFQGGYAPATTGGAPVATVAPAGGSTINVNPSVNVQPPASGGTSGTSGGSTAPGSTTGGTTGSGTSGGSTTAPAKP
jgi:hypothetical protein